jgi:predicted TIM-barrel fold metal-dependent hydrolase
MGIIDAHAHQGVREAQENLKDPYWKYTFDVDPATGFAEAKQGPIQNRPHFNLDELFHGTEVMGLSEDDTAKLDKVSEGLSGGPAARVAAMDAIGHSMNILSNPSHDYNYWIDPEYAVPFSRDVNDGLSEYCDYAPDRLGYWAQIPMQAPEEAAAELDRAVRFMRAKGFAMGGGGYGAFEADAPELDVVWAKACDHDVPVWVHGYNESAAWKKPEKYAVTSIIGMNYDETRLFWNMICGGVFDRFPSLHVIITHGGGFVPYQIGRFKNLNPLLTDAVNKKPLMHYVQNNFLFDVHTNPQMRQTAVDVFGPERFVYGDNFGHVDTIEDKTEMLDIGEADKEKIRSGNIATLLHL